MITMHDLLWYIVSSIALGKGIVVHKMPCSMIHSREHKEREWSWNNVTQNQPHFTQMMICVVKLEKKAYPKYFATELSFVNHSTN